MKNLKLVLLFLIIGIPIVTANATVNAPWYKKII